MRHTLSLLLGDLGVTAGLVEVVAGTSQKSSTTDGLEGFCCVSCAIQAADDRVCVDIPRLCWTWLLFLDYDWERRVDLV